MKRLIKYRIWSYRYNHYITPEGYEGEHLVLRPDGKLYDADCSIEYPGEWSEAAILDWDDQSEESEVELFTGFYDKKDKPIYEGDIVNAKICTFDGDPDISGSCVKEISKRVIHFKNGSFMIGEYYLPELVDDGSIEVVGNIHCEEE